MQHFEAVRSHLQSRHTLRHDDPYLMSFDMQLPQGRHQGIYLTELEGERGRRYLRISTPIGPLERTDPKRALRFNWEQRTGFLAVTDLDGKPFLHLCENRLFEHFDEAELERIIDEMGTLGNQLEQALAETGDNL